MGRLGENKQDLMVYCCLFPTGYGKKFMGYAAGLGLVFMKINVPELGHDVCFWTCYAPSLPKRLEKT